MIGVESRGGDGLHWSFLQDEVLVTEGRGVLCVGQARTSKSRGSCMPVQRDLAMAWVWVRVRPKWPISSCRADESLVARSHVPRPLNCPACRRVELYSTILMMQYSSDTFQSLLA